MTTVSKSLKMYKINMTLTPVWVVSLFTFFIIHTLSAQQSDTVRTFRQEAEKQIFFIGHLNPDSYKDTVVGGVTTTFQHVPKEIRWGRVRPDDETDSNYVPPVHEKTLLHFPNWKGFGCSAAHYRISTDTLSDLVYFFWGNVTRNGEEHREFRALVVFGQKGLDSISEISLGDIDTVQTEPFFAQRLLPQNDLRDPAIRQMSGTISFTLPKINERKPRKDPVEDSRVTPPQWNVSLAPNPASTSITVRMSGVPAGKYLLEIMTLQGVVSRRQSLHTSYSEQQEVIPLDMLASGYYLLTIKGDGVLIGPLPFVTIH